MGVTRSPGGCPADPRAECRSSAECRGHFAVVLAAAKCPRRDAGGAGGGRAGSALNVVGTSLSSWQQRSAHVAGGWGCVGAGRASNWGRVRGGRPAGRGEWPGGQVTRVKSAGRSRWVPSVGDPPEAVERVPDVGEPGRDRHRAKPEPVGRPVVADHPGPDQRLAEPPRVEMMQRDVAATAGISARRGEPEAVRLEPLVGKVDQIAGERDALGAEPFDPCLGQQPHPLGHGDGPDDLPASLWRTARCRAPAGRPAPSRTDQSGRTIPTPAAAAAHQVGAHVTGTPGRPGRR